MTRLIIRGVFTASFTFTWLLCLRDTAALRPDPGVCLLLIAAVGGGLLACYEAGRYVSMGLGALFLVFSWRGAWPFHEAVFAVGVALLIGSISAWSCTPQPPRARDFEA